MRLLSCKTCGKQAVESDFYRNATARGRTSSCKECIKARVRQHRANNLERVREYDRERADQPHRVEARKARAHRYADRDYRSAWRKRNPEKWKAHCALNNALRDGKIQRLTRCERCNGSYAVQAHHEDYSKPLDVIWLCVRCHGQRHREINEEKRIAA